MQRSAPKSFGASRAARAWGQLAEPIEGGDEPEGKKRHGGFIVARGQAPILLHSVEEALDLVAVLVVLLIQYERFAVVGSGRLGMTASIGS